MTAPDLFTLLERHAPALCERLRGEHARLDGALAGLKADIDEASTAELYVRTCEFVAAYLAHLHEEEQRCEAIIRATLSPDELLGFGRESVARTAPADQVMMLKWMFAAMTRADVESFLAKLPAEVAERLRPLAAA